MYNAVHNGKCNHCRKTELMADLLQKIMQSFFAMLLTGDISIEKEVLIQISLGMVSFMSTIWVYLAGPLILD